MADDRGNEREREERPRGRSASGGDDDGQDGGPPMPILDRITAEMDAVATFGLEIPPSQQPRVRRHV